jgi:hypothetical protein
VFSKDIQSAAQRKLQDLKELEKEWFSRREATDEIEKSLGLIEHEIEERSNELKTLVMKAKSKTRLEHEAPKGQEFSLADGRRIRSFLELRVALHSMPDVLFSHHVTASRNDFAVWARECFKDQEMANALSHAHTKDELAQALSRLG